MSLEKTIKRKWVKKKKSLVVLSLIKPTSPDLPKSFPEKATILRSFFLKRVPNLKKNICKITKKNIKSMISTDLKDQTWQAIRYHRIK